MRNIDNIKPNLFIIGATKCGTTYLHNILKSHPEIFMTEPKEPGFFLGPKISKFKTIDDYLNLFKGACKFPIRGESSTGYTHYPYRLGVPRAIYNFNPNAFIIYIIRDPIDRTISHYWWNVRWEGEKRDPYTAIINDNFYRDVSYYAMQIKQFLKYFSYNKILITTLESLKRDPLPIIQSIFGWLGVDKNFIPNNIYKYYNKTPQIIIKPRILFLERIRYSKFWDKISPLFPKKLKRFLTNLNKIQIEKSKYDFSDIIKILRDQQLKQTEELLTLIDIDKTKIMSQWKTLYAKE